VPFADELEKDILDAEKLAKIAVFYPGRVQRTAAGLEGI
jgi:hypothetical protein